jgi:hypothetical protein
MTIPVSHSKQSEKQFARVNGKKSIKYSITALRENHLELQSNAKILKEVSLNCGLGKKIEILYTGNSKSIANKLKDLLELGSGMRISTKKTTQAAPSGFRKKYSDFIFDVIIYLE